jgi:glucokinase
MALIARVRALLRTKSLHDQVRRQTAELENWNRKLKERVDEQVAEIERMGRLRRFFSPQVADIIARGDEKLLKGHRCDITVVYGDLRGFTAFSEANEPEDTVRLLSEYHAALGPLVHERGGTIERFLGDGFLVLFNDPVPCANPGEQAVRMAVAMRERMNDIAAQWRRSGFEFGFSIGIAQGYATLGRIGFEGRYEYSAVGNVANLGARLCQEAKPGQIVVSQRVVPEVEAFLRSGPSKERVREAAFAIAAPITGDHVAFTNSNWQFSIADLRKRLELERLDILNDFTANAVALPYLKGADLEQVDGGFAVLNRPIGVLGPGTGLGVSGLVPSAVGWVPLTGEGGHGTLPATTAREARVIERLQEKYGHVSAERALSGEGLLSLYTALAAIEAAPAAAKTAADVTTRALDGSDRLAVDAVDLFCAFLGTVASDLALTLGAQGGIYIAGGIVPRWGATFAKSSFRARFEAKGRFGTYLATIPTSVVRHNALAFVGLANFSNAGAFPFERATA